jgi:SAM-dependent methyltransferase
MGTTLVGSPDTVAKGIKRLLEYSQGGFGGILFRAHEWANAGADDAQLRTVRPLRDAATSRDVRLIERHAAVRPILELGCGGGRDSATLAAAGHRVIGIDRSAKAIEKARQRVPTGTFQCQDLRVPFPVGEAAAGVVIASLSLHYFPWVETEELVRRVRRTLMPGGCAAVPAQLDQRPSLRSGRASAIEANYYNVDGEPKRFFDRASVDRLFGDGWRTIELRRMGDRPVRSPQGRLGDGSWSARRAHPSLHASLSS